MTEWQSGDVDVRGIRLHYTRTGGDKPPMVLAHGFSDDGLCWTPFAKEFAGEYDLIMIDARGHGRSSAPEKGYGPVDQANDIVGVIEHFGLTKPYILGHSMGALTALALTGTYPDLPRAIMLEAPPPWWVSPPPDAVPADAPSNARAPRADWITALKQMTRDEIIAAKHGESPSWSDAELGPWADSKLMFDMKAAQFIQPGISAGIHWPNLVSKITCPALLITGDTALGAIASTDDANALQRLIPQLEIAHLPGAGHNIRREQFGPYLEAVRGFLAETRTT